MSQEALGTIINTHPAGGKQDGKDTCAISTDLLISMARYFNVTTDYIPRAVRYKTGSERANPHESGDGSVL